MGNPRRANGSRRDAIRARLRSLGGPCWICRAFGLDGTIDYSLPHLHPYAFEADELVPVSKGGDPLDPRNVAPAHRCCNQWRGNKSVDEVLALAGSGLAAPTRKARPRPELPASREW